MVWADRMAFPRIFSLLDSIQYTPETLFRSCLSVAWQTTRRNPQILIEFKAPRRCKELKFFTYNFFASFTLSVKLPLPFVLVALAFTLSVPVAMVVSLTVLAFAGAIGLTVIMVLFLPVTDIFGIPQADDLGVTFFSQTWGQMLGADSLPGTVVTRSDVPVTFPTLVKPAVDMEHVEIHTHCDIEAQMGRKEKQRWFGDDYRRRDAVADMQIETYIGGKGGGSGEHNGDKQ
jgi:hypothetical protein